MGMAWRYARSWCSRSASPILVGVVVFQANALTLYYGQVPVELEASSWNSALELSDWIPGWYPEHAMAVCPFVISFWNLCLLDYNVILHAIRHWIFLNNKCCPKVLKYLHNLFLCLFFQILVMSFFSICGRFFRSQTDVVINHETCIHKSS